MTRSLRSQSLPPCPGPPPTIPPPPLPNVSARCLTNNLPCHSPHVTEGQRSGRPQAQGIKEGVIWPKKTLKEDLPNPLLEEGPPLLRKPTVRSTSLPSGSSSVSSKTEKDPQSSEPPVPPVRSASHKRRALEVRAAVGNSRGVVHRKTGSVKRRVSLTGSKTPSFAPTNRSPISRAAPQRPSCSPTDTPPGSPLAVAQPSENSPDNKLSSCSSPTLNKKRSFFRRVADRLTRSRNNLRDEAHGGKVHPSSTAEEVVALHASDGDAISSVLQPSSSSSLSALPTSSRARKARPLSIKVPSSNHSSRSFVVIGDGQSFDPDLKSPSRIPLPPSPAYSSIYAATPCTGTTSSGFLSPSTLATPTTPTQDNVSCPRVPRKSASASALSELSRHSTVSPLVDNRQPSLSSHGLTFPPPPNLQSGLQERGKSDDNITIHAEHSRTNIVSRYVQMQADSRLLVDLGRVGPISPLQENQTTRDCDSNHTFPNGAQSREDVPQSLRHRSSDLRLCSGGHESLQPECQANSSKLSSPQKSTKLRSVLAVTRTDAHARADSHTLGDLLLSLPQSSSRAEQIVHEDARPGPASFLPSPVKSLAKGGGNESRIMGDDDEDVQLPNLKVSRWLAESPLTPASNPPQQPSTLSMSDSSFDRGIASFDTWRTVLETETVDDHLLPEILAHEAKEIRKKGDVERGRGKPQIEYKTIAPRSRSLFGRKREILDRVVTPSGNHSLKETNRRSFRFLAARTADLPPSPALPSGSTNHGNPASTP